MESQPLHERGQTGLCDLGSRAFQALHGVYLGNWTGYNSRIWFTCRVRSYRYYLELSDRKMDGQSMLLIGSYLPS